MKMLTYNVRSGTFEKINEVRRLVSEKKHFVLCLQETKLSTVDEIMVSTLWGSGSYGFSFKPSSEHPVGC